MPAGGTVILLNGASSSGKTSIARSLLNLLDGSWFLLSPGAGAQRIRDFLADRTRPTAFEIRLGEEGGRLLDEQGGGLSRATP